MGKVNACYGLDLDHSPIVHMLKVWSLAFGIIGRQKNLSEMWFSTGT